MAVGICLISGGSEPGDTLRSLLERCGLDVWTPQSPDACDGAVYDHAVCLVIDMPQGAGFRTLRLFRSYGVTTPALLIVDPGREVDPVTLDCEAVMDVIARNSSPLQILRWVQSLCAARKLLQRRQQPLLQVQRSA